MNSTDSPLSSEDRTASASWAGICARRGISHATSDQVWYRNTRYSQRAIETPGRGSEWVQIDVWAILKLAGWDIEPCCR